MIVGLIMDRLQSPIYNVIYVFLKENLMKSRKLCIGRESNPGRPRGRRAFYHWTTDASTNVKVLIANGLWAIGLWGHHKTQLWAYGAEILKQHIVVLGLHPWSIWGKVCPPPSPPHFKGIKMLIWIVQSLCLICNSVYLIWNSMAITQMFSLPTLSYPR